MPAAAPASRSGAPVSASVRHAPHLDVVAARSARAATELRRPAGPTRRRLYGRARSCLTEGGAAYVVGTVFPNTSSWLLVCPVTLPAAAAAAAAAGVVPASALVELGTPLPVPTPTAGAVVAGPQRRVTYPALVPGPGGRLRGTRVPTGRLERYAADVAGVPFVPPRVRPR